MGMDSRMRIYILMDSQSPLAESLEPTRLAGQRRRVVRRGASPPKLGCRPRSTVAPDRGSDRGFLQRLKIRDQVGEFLPAQPLGQAVGHDRGVALLPRLREGRAGTEGPIDTTS